MGFHSSSPRHHVFPLMVMLKKAASGVLGFFAVLTYRVYAPRVNNGRALGDAASNTAALLDLPLPQRLRAGQADFFEHSRRQIISNSSRVRMLRA